MTRKGSEDLHNSLLQSPDSALTFRSLIIGILCVVFVSIVAPASLLIYRSSLLACDFFPLGVMLPFTLVVAGINVLLKLVNRSMGLTPKELIFIFIMGLIACTIPTFGLVAYMLSISSSPYYYASTENQFEEHVFPHLNSWSVVKDVDKTVEWFFEGLPQGESIPWGPWIIPTVWWVGVAMAAFLMCFFLVVILRKQWMENENIAYPLTEIPLTMVEDSNDRRLMPRFMRTRLFWIGFAIPFAIIVWNMLNWIWPTFPSINLNRRLPIGSIELHLYTKFPVIGFT